MKESKNVIIAILGSVLIGGAGFYGGTLYQKSVTSRGVLGGRAGANMMARGEGGLNGVGGQRAGMMGFRPIVGQILSKDDKGITVKMQDGSSKIILFSATTTISKADKIDVTALNIGDAVRVIGSTNADGSVTAQDVQLNPAQSPQGQNQPGQ